jgi:hypothetical protein
MTNARSLLTRGRPLPAGSGAAPPHPGPAALRSWRTGVSLAAIGGGAAILVGSFLPWATAFAGLVSFRGISAQNGRILAAIGAVTLLAGGWHLVRGSEWSRWLAGLAGFAAAGLSAFLLLRLTGELRSMGADSMVVLRGGPGLWVAVTGGLLAFATLFLPSSAQRTLRDPAAKGSLLAWAADRESAGPRRALQIGLGAVWVLDAALQFQPFMFGRGFVTRIIDPAAMGSPAFLSGSVMSAGQFLLHDIAAWNAGFATIQLLLGLGLLGRRTVRAALAGTVIWGLAVWYLGESLGGLLSGAASPLTGAPGGALLYVLIAILIWPRATGPASAGPASAGPVSVAASGLLGDRWSRLLWAVVWGGFAALMFQPQVRAPGAIAAAVGAQATGEPGWLAAVDRGVAGGLGTSGLVPVVIFAVIFAVIAIGVEVPWLIRPALVLAAAVALLIWLPGENLGGILTGTGTDPATGPLLVLLAAAYWPARRRTRGAGSGRVLAEL